jgi:1-acyl-sn-glycerol-3-phosphate acyltransferase
MKTIRRKYIIAQAIKPILKMILPYIYNIHYHYEHFEEVKPPYFIMGNHTSALDPFIMSMGNHHHINYVTNDEYFRFPIIKLFMKLMGAIPKTKFMSDYKTVKDILELRKENAVIGIYPEGGRTWPGKTQELLFATSKLIKKMEIPVVVVVTKGGCLAFPRWGKKFRRGRVDVHFKALYRPEDITSLSAEDIHKGLEHALSNDDIVWQKENMIPFKGKKLVERLEWFIYACPKCEGLESMTSLNDIYTCRCGYSVKYNEYGFFEENGSGEVLYDNVNDWNDYQHNHFKQLIQKWFDDPNSKEFCFKKDNCTLKKGKRGEKNLVEVLTGTLFLTKQGFRIADAINSVMMDTEHVSGLVVNHKNVIDFYHNGEKYRIQLQSKNECGYILEDAMKILKEIQIKKQ